MSSSLAGTASFNELDPGRALRKAVLSSARTSTGAPAPVFTETLRAGPSTAVTSPRTESALRGASGAGVWLAGAGPARIAAINQVVM